jgi:fatty-acyl-CoA synthase
MMSSALSEGPGEPGAAAGTVFRSELNPVDFLHRAAYLYPDKVAVAAGKRRYSYRELAERSWRLANALRSAGLAKGDRVAALLFNSPAMLEAHFGVPAAGGILVAVNNRLSSAEVGYILQHSGARYLLVDAVLEAHADVPGVTVIRCDDTGVPGDPYEEFLAGATGELAGARRGDDLDQLHLGDHGPAQGGAVHLPRRVPERAERGDRGRPEP